MAKLYHALTGEPADDAVQDRLRAPETGEPMAGILTTER